jgi:hypothetical protein
MAAFIQTYKPEHGFLNSMTHSQQPMILQERGLMRSETLCNIVSLLFVKNYTIEGSIDHMIL